MRLRGLLTVVLFILQFTLPRFLDLIKMGALIVSDLHSMQRSLAHLEACLTALSLSLTHV